mgnify:FL=1|jgi:hypothetical protein
MKGVNHYTKDGSVHKGSMHKMDDGTLHSGKKHDKNSVKLLHYGDLSKKQKALVKALRT